MYKRQVFRLLHTAQQYLFQQKFLILSFDFLQKFLQLAGIMFLFQTNPLSHDLCKAPEGGKPLGVGVVVHTVDPLSLIHIYGTMILSLMLTTP